jgi:hypothetical protein
MVEAHYDVSAILPRRARAAAPLRAGRPIEIEVQNGAGSGAERGGFRPAPFAGPCMATPGAGRASPLWIRAGLPPSRRAVPCAHPLASSWPARNRGVTFV